VDANGLKGLFDDWFADSFSPDDSMKQINRAGQIERPV
jgi:hypothetical protein